MSSRAVLVLGSVFLVVASLTTADTVNIDTGIAALYVDAAATALSGDDRGRAAQLASLALEHNESSSDALLVRSLAYAGNQEMTQVALSSAKAAIAADTWQRFHPLEGSIALASLLIQIREYDSVQSVIDSLRESITSPDLADHWISTTRYLDARSLYSLGQVAAANEAIEAGLARYPNDSRLFHLEMLQEPFPSYRQRAELERLLRETGTADEYLMASILLYAESASSEAEQRWGMDLYLEQNGSDPAIALVAAKLDGWDAGVTLFEALDGYQRVDVMRDLLALMDDNASIPLGATEFAGKSWVDSDRDGFAEQLFYTEGGFIVSWQVDENQDGVPEYDVQFGDGEPSSVVVRTNAVPVTIRYDVYPFARSVEITHPDGKEVLTVRPSSVIFRVAESIPAEGAKLVVPISLPARLPTLDLDAYHRSSHQIDWTGGVEGGSDRRFYESGLLVRSMHDTDGDGAWDRLAVYTDELPLAVLRDIDGDGYFEVAETYESGRLAAVIVDDNDNGIPDLYERREESGTRDWDLNEDGSIDVREFGILVDEVRRSFPFAEDES